MAKINLHPNLDREVKKGVAWAVHAFTTCGIVLGFLALVSVSLGVLNLLPLPVLDGGHLMYYLFEGLSGRPISDWWQQQLQRAGLLILMLMMALALSNDVARYAGWH